MTGDDEIVDFIRRQGTVSVDEVAAQFGLTRTATQVTLRRLKRENRLVRTSVAHGNADDDTDGFHSEWKATPVQGAR